MTAPERLIAVLAKPATLAALDLEELEQLDSAALAQVRSLPSRLQAAEAHPQQDQALHSLRLCIAGRMAHKRQERAALQRMFDQLDTEAAQAPAVEDAPQAPEMTDQERACRLMAAALKLIMQPPPPQQGPGGGTTARLTPPPTNRPPGGGQAPLPTSPTGGLDPLDPRVLNRGIRAQVHAQRIQDAAEQAAIPQPQPAQAPRARF